MQIRQKLVSFYHLLKVHFILKKNSLISQNTMKVDHWQNIYINKNDDQVSWTQQYPQVAMDYIISLDLPLSASIIDVGGGTGNFVDALLDLGYKNISVLDIFFIGTSW